MTEVEFPKIACSAPSREVLEAATNELRHPINSIKGYLEILKRRLDDKRNIEFVMQITRVVRVLTGFRDALNDYTVRCLENEQINSSDEITALAIFQKLIYKLDQLIEVITNRLNILQKLNDEYGKVIEEISEEIGRLEKLCIEIREM